MQGAVGVDSVKLRQMLEGLLERFECEAAGTACKGKAKEADSVSREENPELQLLQEELQRVLGTKVRLDYREGKGKIEIEYYSDEELERILDLMRG